MLIKIKKEYLSEFDDVELATYITMMSLCMRKENNWINPSQVVYQIYGNSKRDQQIRRRHTDAFYFLINKGYISGKKIDRYAYAISVPDATDWEFYATVTPEEIQPIFSSNYRNKLAMLQVLVAVLMCRSKRSRYKVCDVSMTLLCEYTHKSYNTVQRALENLVDAEVLYKAKICDHRANVYGLMADKDSVDRYVNRKKQTDKTKPERPATASINRLATAHLERLATDNDYIDILGAQRYSEIMELKPYDLTLAELNTYKNTGELPSRINDGIN